MTISDLTACWLCLKRSDCIRQRRVRVDSVLLVYQCAWSDARYRATRCRYNDLESLKGLDIPTDYGSGIEYADGILNSVFPNVGVGLQVSLSYLLCRFC